MEDKSVNLDQLKKELSLLIGIKLNWLSLPTVALAGFEPSQIAVIVNTLLDGILPQIQLLASDPENAKKLKEIGLSKPKRAIGERESYPDYIHKSGYRIELKGLFVDNPKLSLKRPPSLREPSARLKDNVTAEVIDPEKDLLLVVAVQLKEEAKGICNPTIIDLDLFPMKDCLLARNKRLTDCGGKWIGGVPKVLSNKGAEKMKRGERLADADYEHDTNFGKLKRIPYPPLQDFMRKHGVIV